MRKCPFTACGRSIPDDIFVCKPHWFRLSPAERATINEAWSNYQINAIGIDELRRIQQSVLGNRGTA